MRLRVLVLSTTQHNTTRHQINATSIMETSAESDNHSIAASGAELVGGSTASEGGSTAGAQEDSDRQRAAPSQEFPQGEGGAEEQEEESTRQQQVQIAGGDEDNGGGNGTSVSVAVSACSVTADSASTTAAVHVVASSRSEKLQEGSSSSTNHRQDDSQTDDGAETEPASTCAAPTTHANAKADMEQEQSQHETEDGEDPHFDASDTSIALPDEAMAARSGYHLNLSSLPPGAYLVEPAYPTAYPRASSSSDEQVMTAEVRLARDGEGEGTEEDESTTDGASRSSMSTLTMNHPSIATSRRSSGGTGVIAASRQSSGGTGVIAASRRSSGGTGVSTAGVSTAGVSTAGASTAGANTDDAIVHHVVTATCVDEECIVDAHPVPDEGEMVLQVRAERDEHRQQVVTLRKRQHRLVLGGAVLALAVLAVALGVVFGNNGGNNEGVDTAGAAQVDADRLEALRAIVLPLSGHVFNPTSPGYSEQRVAALDWLANDRYATERLPTDDPSLTWKIQQRYVMGLFHIMTDSPNWFDDFNSLTDRDECDWNRASSLQGMEAEDIYSGVEKEVEVKGIICDESGRVKRIILCKSSVRGTA